MVSRRNSVANGQPRLTEIAAAGDETTVVMRQSVDDLRMWLTPATALGVARSPDCGWARDDRPAVGGRIEARRGNRRIACDRFATLAWFCA